MSFTLHTCFRCGREFSGTRMARVCNDCAVEGKRPMAQLGDPFTARESHVITHLLRGCTNKEIAARLFLTEGTIKEYLYNIFRKTGVSSRLELALKMKEKLHEVA